WTPGWVRFTPTIPTKVGQFSVGVDIKERPPLSRARANQSRCATQPSSVSPKSSGIIFTLCKETRYTTVDEQSAPPSRFAFCGARNTIDTTWEHLAHSQVRRRRALGWLAAIALCALLWVGSAWPEASFENQGLEWLGLAFIILAILGRTACMLYVGGRKGSDLVTEGPYSVSRNPLYVFSILAVLGIGLQTGSLIIGLILASAAYLVFRWIVGEEEILLRLVFGESFEVYCRDVPRFCPRWSLWRSPQHITVDLHGVWKTVRDALPYFLAIPVFELIEAAQRVGWIHVRVSLF
ncbi:methyltransferase family protein, partial [Castellaniella hirudinis]|uniref:methyltransferase family protein n=1 Tax=Castellaniella hirudinis TaxID=1144617 RepID=UPI0039C00857